MRCYITLESILGGKNERVIAENKKSKFWPFPISHRAPAGGAELARRAVLNYQHGLGFALQESDSSYTDRYRYR